MGKDESKNCELCGVELIEKCEKYGKDGYDRCISRHHYYPKRFMKRNLFTEEKIRELFGVDTNDVAVLCYGCHEELLHNIVINKIIIKRLSELIVGTKSLTERVVILHNQLLK